MSSDAKKQESSEIHKKPKKFPWIIPFSCEGCGDCVEVCPTGSVELVDLGKKVDKAWITSPDTCIGCGKCAEACVVGAVQMTEYVDRAIKRYKEKKTPD